ncbi:hypothetical protein CCACVL1_05235 [Corchorus capsularis]|uniref:Uncharacterized protein n=1 Tax=Corchorus capsularis TaxID=210143 RepID=A0A1R3JLU8_COCAP|nr:hypothetical protein CCACVL1_05235 [Corchorus capsularis]
MAATFEGSQCPGMVLNLDELAGVT